MFERKYVDCNNRFRYTNQNIWVGSANVLKVRCEVSVVDRKHPKAKPFAFTFCTPKGVQR